MPALTVNGKSHSLDVPPDMPLLWALRDVIGLTGTNLSSGGIIDTDHCQRCSATDIKAYIDDLKVP